MKRRLTVIALIIMSIASSFAQDKQHSIEITTGYPSIMHFAEYPWAYRTVEMEWNGMEWPNIQRTLPTRNQYRLYISMEKEMGVQFYDQCPSHNYGYLSISITARS